MNLALAVLWMAAGIGLLVYEAVTGTKRFQIFGSGISAAWFCFVLAAYNVVRWYSTIAAQKDREAMRLAEAARARRHRERPREDPDPNFDFTSKPPDVPPSNT